MKSKYALLPYTITKAYMDSQAQSRVGDPPLYKYKEFPIGIPYRESL